MTGSLDRGRQKSLVLGAVAVSVSGFNFVPTIEEFSQNADLFVVQNHFFVFAKNALFWWLVGIAIASSLVFSIVLHGIIT